MVVLGLVSDTCTIVRGCCSFLNDQTANCSEANKLDWMARPVGVSNSHVDKMIDSSMGENVLLLGGLTFPRQVGIHQADIPPEF